MSYTFNGGDRLRGSFTSAYDEPITMACFVKVAAHPIAVQSYLSLGANIATNTDYFVMRTVGVDNQWRTASIDSGGTTAVTTRTQDIDGVWAGIVGKFTSETDRTIYVQALANSNNNTDSKAMAAVQHIAVGEAMDGGADWNGQVAEVAIWNKALSDAEITSFMAGEAASGIAAANLIGYWPMSVDQATHANQGLDADGLLTVTNAVFSADHPTITQPSASAKKRRGLLLGVGG